MRRSNVVGLIAAAALALSGTACSLLTPLDGYSGTVIVVGPEAGDAAFDAPLDGPLDTGMETSSIADAGDDAGGPNLEMDGTFEGSNCVRWSGYEANVDKTEDAAHSGSGACRVCAKSGSYFTADDTGQAGAAIVGATYRAEGWVRNAPGRSTPGLTSLHLRNFSNNGTFVELQSESSTPTQLDDVWKRFEAQLTVTKPGGLLNIFIGADNLPNACFLFDDVVLQRVK